MIRYGRKLGVQLSLIAWIPLLALVLAWAATNKNATTEVCGQPGASLTASPASIFSGNSTSLTWSANNARTLSSNFGVTALSGSVSRTPASAGTWTYSVTGECSGLTASASASVSVSNPPPPSSRCFVAGTKITLADGSMRNVEDLRAGDLVRSYDVSTGKFVESKVTMAKTGTWDEYIQINGSHGVTPPHLFYANGDFKKAGDLQIGDELLDGKGQPFKITSLVRKPGPVDIFPIQVEDPPATYIAENTVVHNRNQSSAKDEGLVAGSLIRMADGSLKPIEEVKPGQLVLAYLPDQRAFAMVKVRSASRDTTAEYLVINGKLKIAPKHPILQVFRGKKNIKRNR